MSATGPRHKNLRALTVNTTRVNTKPQKPPQRQRMFEDLADVGGGYGYDSDHPATLGANFMLMLSGQSRAGRLPHG